MATLSLWYSSLGNPMDRGAWRAVVHGVTKELDMTYLLNSNNMYIYVYIYMDIHTENKGRSKEVQHQGLLSSEFMVCLVFSSVPSRFGQSLYFNLRRPHPLQHLT